MQQDTARSHKGKQKKKAKSYMPKNWWPKFKGEGKQRSSRSCVLGDLGFAAGFRPHTAREAKGPAASPTEPLSTASSLVGP